MSTELKFQRKIAVGPANSPTYIGEFHPPYGGEQLFHSYCREHEDSFGYCGTEAEAKNAAEVHLLEAHRDRLIELIPEGSFVVSEKELAQELEYRLRTVTALGLMRGKHREKMPEDFIAHQIELAVKSLAAKAAKAGRK